MRKKAILSLDKFAKGNNLSADQLSTIKGGRKKMTRSFNTGESDDNLGGKSGIDTTFGG